MSKEKDAVLVRYSVVLQQDGSIRSTVQNIDPKTFMELANSLNSEWADAPVISKLVEYVLIQLKALDEDLDKYLLTL